MLNRRIPSIVAPLVALTLGLAACGSGSDGESAGDDTTAATTTGSSSAESVTDDTSETSSSDSTGGTADSTADSAAGSTTAPPEGAPNATLPADMPAELAPAYRPLEVVGESLPVYADEAPDADPAVGTPAPVIIGYDLNQEPITVDASVDGPTMLVFLAHWCPHCNDELPVIKEMSDAGQLDDVNVVAVMTGSDPSAANFPPDQWLKDNEWPYPAVYEGVTIAEVDGEEQATLAALPAFGGSGFPFVVLIDGEGNVTARWSGARSAEEITELLDANLR